MENNKIFTDSLQIYSEHIGPRLQYVVRFIFEDFYGIGAVITDDKEHFMRSGGPKLSYRNEMIGDEISIIPSGLLSEDLIKEIHPEAGRWHDLKTIFLVQGDSSLPFDLFAAIFYLLARYEEYLPYEGDQYGRFPAEKSISFRNGFLDQAIVDRWLMRFFDILKARYPEIRMEKRNFRFIPTVDVDMPFEFLHKGTLRCLGGFIKSVLTFDFKGVRDRLNVVTGKKPDSFYTFERIRGLHNNPGMVTFFLTARYGKYDKSIDPASMAFKDMVKYVSSFSFIGLHPSWASNRGKDLLAGELNMLGRIAEKTIMRSRQHYLRMKLPFTYDQLSSFGMKEEYSMGYASHTGFRAGTCTPFRFYDLVKEREIDLVIYPFQVMDRTLKDYMNLQPSEAINKVKVLIDEVRSVNGTFISIWHNDAFSDKGEWKGWLDVYRHMPGAVSNNNG